MPLDIHASFPHPENSRPAYISHAKIEPERVKSFKTQAPFKITQKQDAPDQEKAPPPTSTNNSQPSAGAVLTEIFGTRREMSATLYIGPTEKKTLQRPTAKRESQRSNGNNKNIIKESNKELRSEVMRILFTMKKYIEKGKEKSEDVQWHECEQRLRLIAEISPVLKAFIADKRKSVLGPAKKNASIESQLLQKRKRELRATLRDLHGKTFRDTINELHKIDRELSGKKDDGISRKKRRTRGLEILRNRKGLERIRRLQHRTRKQLFPYMFSDEKLEQERRKKADAAAKALRREKEKEINQTLEQKKRQEEKMLTAITANEYLPKKEKSPFPWLSEKEIEEEEKIISNALFEDHKAVVMDMNQDVSTLLKRYKKEINNNALRGEHYKIRNKELMFHYAQMAQIIEEKTRQQEEDRALLNLLTTESTDKDADRKAEKILNRPPANHWQRVQIALERHSEKKMKRRRYF